LFCDSKYQLLDNQQNKLSTHFELGNDKRETETLHFNTIANIYEPTQNRNNAELYFLSITSTVFGKTGNF